MQNLSLKSTRYGYILTEFNSIVQVVHRPVAHDTALSRAMNNQKYTVWISADDRVKFLTA